MCSVMCLHYTYLKLNCWLFFRQIETDSEFLRTQRIMDYSLLLGVHYRAPQHLRTRASYRRSMAANRLTVVSEVGKDAPDTFHKIFLPTISVAHLHECKEKTHELMFDMWSISTLCAQLEPVVAKLLTIFSWFFCLKRTYYAIIPTSKVTWKSCVKSLSVLISKSCFELGSLKLSSSYIWWDAQFFLIVAIGLQRLFCCFNLFIRCNSMFSSCQDWCANVHCQ